jgi:uncharacterized protein YceK
MTPVRRVMLRLTVSLSAIGCAAVMIPAAAGPASASTVAHQVSHASNIGPVPCCDGWPFTVR